MILLEIAGWLGMGMITAAYFLLSRHRIESGSKVYQLLNLGGALLLGVQLFYQQSWPAFSLQVVWGTIALFALNNQKETTRE